MKYILAVMLAVLSISTAHADGNRNGNGGDHLVTHNGSLMTVRTWDGNVEIRYTDPKPSLWPWGVRPGTLLIAGHWDGPVLNATAFVFGCGPVPYAVSGGVGPDGVLVLQGPAPVVDVISCTVLFMDWTSNSTLVFVPYQNGRH